MAIFQVDTHVFFHCPMEIYLHGLHFKEKTKPALQVCYEIYWANVTFFEIFEVVRHKLGLSVQVSCFCLKGQLCRVLDLHCGNSRAEISARKEATKIHFRKCKGRSNG